jgi:hypothetical protein
MPVKRISKSFEELKKELEAEATGEEELTNKLESVVVDIFEHFLNPEIKYEYDIAVDPDGNYILTIKLSNSGIELEDSAYELDAVFSKVFSIPPKDKAMRIRKDEAVIVYKIVRGILASKTMREIERDLGDVTLKLASERYKREQELAKFLSELMGRKKK